MTLSHHQFVMHNAFTLTSSQQVARALPLGAARSQAATAVVQGQDRPRATSDTFPHAKGGKAGRELSVNMTGFECQSSKSRGAFGATSQLHVPLPAPLPLPDPFTLAAGSLLPCLSLQAVCGG